MSADNGIYILETKRADGWEYRVAHLQAIENINYDEEAPDAESCEKYNQYLHTPCAKCIAWDKKFNSEDKDVMIRNARRMWKNSPMFLSQKDAWLYAQEMDATARMTEYGVCRITIDREF